MEEITGEAEEEKAAPEEAPTLEEPREEEATAEPVAEDIELETVGSEARSDSGIKEPPHAEAPEREEEPPEEG
jgi:hypothetical protein